MPCIIIRTNVEIPSDRAKELKTALAVSWEKVPTKRERWLMIVMEDKQQMFFSGRDTPAAFVNFKIHGDYDTGYRHLCHYERGRLPVRCQGKQPATYC